MTTATHEVGGRCCYYPVGHRVSVRDDDSNGRRGAQPLSCFASPLTRDHGVIPHPPHDATSAFHAAMLGYQGILVVVEIKQDKRGEAIVFALPTKTHEL